MVESPTRLESRQPGDSSVVAVQAFLDDQSYEAAEEACRRLGWQPGKELKSGELMSALVAALPSAERRVNILFGTDITGDETLTGKGPKGSELLASKPEFNGVMFVRSGETRHAIPIIHGTAFNHVRDGLDMLDADTRFVFEIDMPPGATAAE
jgi:hypothetical protein